jgi:hypothetical protein
MNTLRLETNKEYKVVVGDEDFISEKTFKTYGDAQHWIRKTNSLGHVEEIKKAGAK